MKPTYITIVKFRAYNRDHVISFEDTEIVMRYVVKRRIRVICPTSIIKSVRLYESHLLNEEKIKEDDLLPTQQQ